HEESEITHPGSVHNAQVLGTETERDLFRILKNFARLATLKRQPDFPFAIQNVAARLGVSFQYVSQLRRHFVKLCIIAETERAVTNRCAARFRWCLPLDQISIGG